MMDVLKLAKQTIPDTHDRRIYRGEGMTDDIFERIRLDVPEAIQQTREFARKLYAQCGYDTECLLRTLYAFLRDNVRLCIDPVGVQYVKKPAALVYDTDRRADCKSYSIFIASVLSNLGIPCRFKFCAWKPYDKNVRHVYIEVFPNDGMKRRVLDVNLKSYNEEKLPNYNNRYIDMTQIYSIGALETPNTVKKIKRDSLLDGRNLAAMLPIELDIRIFRQGLRNERDAVSSICGIGSTEYEVYNDSIDMINDVIGEVVAITRSGRFDDEDIDTRLAGIGYDYVTGKYSLSGVGVCGFFSNLTKGLKKADKKAKPSNMAKSALMTSSKNRLSNRLKLRKSRLVSRMRGKVHHISDVEAIDPYIGGFFSKIKKGIKKAAKAVKKVTKSAAKVAVNTVKKTTKAVATTVKKATTGTLKMVKASVIAPAALVSSKARKELKKTVKSAASDAKDVAKTQKDILTAPLAAATAEILENYLPKAGPFFLYCFMDDKTANKCSSKVRSKRNKANKIRKFIVNVIGVSGSQFDKICRNSIVKEYGKTPEAVIAEKMKGIAGVGVAITAIVSAIVAIISLIMKVFKKKSDAGNVTASDVPDDNDFASVLSQAVNPASSVVNTAKNIKSTATAVVKKQVSDAMTYANSNLTNLQKLTGNARSLVTNAAADVTDTMNAMSTKATDALTNREVNSEGVQKGAYEAVQTTAKQEEAATAQGEGISFKSPYVIGGIALLGGIFLMTRKK